MSNNEIFRLDKLSLFSRKTTTIPESIVELTNLKQINFYGPFSLPKNITSLPLKSFRLSCNNFIDLPDLNSDSLTDLYLSCNKLTSVKGIEKFKNLEALYLNNNLLTSLEEIAELVNLKVLQIVGNKLTSIRGIENLVNLENICLDYNQLTSLEGIEKLINLKILHLEANHLTSLEGIENLTNLEELHIYNNQITSLNGTENLVNLRTFNFHNNKLQSIPLHIINSPKFNDQTQSVLKTLVMTNSVIIKLATDNFDFSEELDRNKRKDPAPGRTTLKSVEF